MGRQDKLMDKLLGDGAFKWSELKTLLGRLNWDERQGSGSRVKFVKQINGISVLMSLHKPHPGNEVREYLRKQVIDKLEEAGDL